MYELKIYLSWIPSYDHDQQYLYPGDLTALLSLAMASLGEKW